jgi:ABC-type dipeptide/oligopeptide/nickel transport system permease subunit
MSLGFHLRTAVAIEASLSYLGFGIQEPSPSFGNMLAAHFDLYLKGQWYVLGILVLWLGVTAAFPQAVLTLSQSQVRRPRIRYT